MKAFFLHRLTLRLVYILGAFFAAHSVSLLTSPAVQAALSSAGLSVMVTDIGALKARITALLLLVGEFVFHFGYEKLVVPHTQVVTGEKI